MATYAVISGDTVTNCIVADTQADAELATGATCVEYTDSNLASGAVPIKNISDKVFEYNKLDIVFISYDEDSADAHYAALKHRFPRALRSHGVKGIYKAHKAAAELASTKLFYVVDADAIIEPTFDFSYYPNGYDISSVHVWYSRNPVNDLIYGYGGIKLFPR